MNQVAKYLRLAEAEEILIENHPAFLRRVAEARTAFRRGGGVRLEDLRE
jgi:hypothetical protein